MGNGLKFEELTGEGPPNGERSKRGENESQKGDNEHAEADRLPEMIQNCNPGIIALSTTYDATAEVFSHDGRR